MTEAYQDDAVDYANELLLFPGMELPRRPTLPMAETQNKIFQAGTLSYAGAVGKELGRRPYDWEMSAAHFLGANGFRAFSRGLLENAKNVIPMGEQHQKGKPYRDRSVNLYNLLKINNVLKDLPNGTYEDLNAFLQKRYSRHGGDPFARTWDTFHD